MSRTPSAALEAHGLSATLGSVEVLHGIDLSLAVGRWTSIVGPNGAGKSTLLKALAGLLAHRGEVRLFGEAQAAVPARVRARRLSWLGQSGMGEGSADDLMVYDVAMLGRLPHQRWLAAPSETDRDAVERALRSTQAWEWRDRPLGQLSGGERQRVLLARALAVEAELLLMDEPLANLDPPHQADWMQTTRELVAQGRTVVSVLHELPMALAADELVVMNRGRVVHHGACADPATHAALEQVFDHRIRVHRVADQWIALPR
ncbi:ABC transporter ATP-binding protein [Acidovorax cavernicola]|uniref:ABC transporter ATP-binding protein n=1 Tax=Acidovorax cavernicola TaxID=1675792 RepID=A0A9X8D992_9BURK|nr:ABC transporter ATP-binding protein [Acidovorax cavernicola]RIX85120.1 ABC transporter ATP-binding protein [Acidovorax cavernicola]